jgi:hypothetical protein
MPLAPALERRLRAYFLDGATERTAPFPVGVGGEWFCPACGVRTTEATPGDVRCPSCDRSLKGFLYELVERHPHRDPDGRVR